MKKTRISYNWFYDFFYTVFWSLVFVNLFGFTIELIMNNDGSFYKFLIAINLLFVPIASFFIGLRPIINLMCIPDTLYKDEKGKVYLQNGELLELNNIKEFNVKEKGLGNAHMYYYEIKLKKQAKLLKNRKRKTIIVSERYNIKNWNSKKLDLLKTFKKNLVNH